MGSPVLKEQVLRYLASKPGETIWRGDIAKDLGFTDQQVSTVIATVLREGREMSTHLVIIDKGRAWRWVDKPSAPLDSTKRLFEEVATIPDGRILVKDTESKVYWLTEV